MNKWRESAKSHVFPLFHIHFICLSHFWGLAWVWDLKCERYSKSVKKCVNHVIMYFHMFFILRSYCFTVFSCVLSHLVHSFYMLLTSNFRGVRVIVQLINCVESESGCVGCTHCTRQYQSCMGSPQTSTWQCHGNVRGASAVRLHVRSFVHFWDVWAAQICTEIVNTQDLNKHLENRIPISSRSQHDSKQVSKPCQQNLDAIPKSFPKLSNSYNKTSKSNCNIKIGGCQGSQKHIPETMTNK